ncbi:src-like-adapter [Microcaecilia unicolor]|uniref:Src-like-adapter n=1 Tax=Microcaecilia unicolor TaxID=1415580 RepID=A0A6P7ZFT4_9AMPH|nr:src-like-adapter [Microcaecilia unicolor]
MGNVMKTAPPVPEIIAPCLTDQESEFLAVLDDYPSPDVSQPIFHFGEKLRVISNEGGWWRVISLTTGRENYIPGKYVARVYYGWLFEGLGREKAEELLQLPSHKTGSFMVRESQTKKGLYSLSIRHSQVKHYRIYRLPNNWYYISPRLTFQCLEHLVNHYSEIADGLCCVLTSPCLTQQNTISDEIRHEPEPVVMRQNKFSWKNVDRLQLINDRRVNSIEMDDSLLSYGLRHSIASYMSLVGDDEGTSFTNNKKKNRLSFPNRCSHKNVLSLATEYFEEESLE